MTGNCIGWTVYSVLIGKNLFLFFANVFGFLVSVWLNLCATKLQYQDHHTAEMKRFLADFLQKGDETQLKNKSKEEHDQSLAALVLNITTQRNPAPAPHQNIVMAIVILWTSLISLVVLADFSTFFVTSDIIIGMVTNVHLLLFYGAPLSTIATVCKTRNSASIHIGTMLMNTTSATFWAIYGLVLWDPFIFVVNGLGTILGAVQLVLYLLLPRLPVGSLPSTFCPESPSQCIAGKDSLFIGCPISSTAGVMLTPAEGLPLTDDLPLPLKDSLFIGCPITSTAGVMLTPAEGLPLTDDLPLSQV